MNPLPHDESRSFQGFLGALPRFWVSPRAAARRAIHSGARWPLLLIAAFYGVRTLLDWEILKGLLDPHFVSATDLIEVALLIGPLVGVALLDLMSLWLTVVGGWLGGKGRFEAVRAAYALSLLPLLGGLVITALQYGIVGDRLFAKGGPATVVSDAQAAVFWASELVGIVLALWSKVGLVLTLAEALQVTVRRSLGIVIVAVTPILVIVSAFSLLPTRMWVRGMLLTIAAVFLGAAVIGGVLAVGFIVNLGRPPAWFIRRLERWRAGGEERSGPGARTPAWNPPLVQFPRALELSLLLSLGLVAIWFDTLLQDKTGLSETVTGAMALMAYALLGVSFIWHFRPDGDRRIKYEWIISGLAFAYAAKFTEVLRTAAGRAAAQAEIAAVGPFNWRFEIAGEYMAFAMWLFIFGALVGLVFRWRSRKAAQPSAWSKRLYRLTRRPGVILASGLFSVFTQPEARGFLLLIAMYLTLRYLIFERMLGKPILFLRSFHDPEVASALGKIVMHTAVRYAPVVTLAHPLQGPEQLYSKMNPEETARMSELGNDVWKDWVTDCLRRCEAVVFDATRGTESLRWELATAQSLVPRSRIAVLIREGAGAEALTVEEGAFVLQYSLGWRNERRARKALKRWFKGLGPRR